MFYPNARRPRATLKTQALSATWWHGAPTALPEDFEELRWDRDRHVASGNQEGPGWYWTTSAEEALSYSKRFDAATDSYAEGCLYEARLRDDARLLTPETRASVAALAQVARAVPRADLEMFLADFGIETVTAAALRDVLSQYAERGTLHEALVTLYHDLFRYDAPMWVAAMRMVADAYVFDRGEYRAGQSRLHLVVYDPRVLVDVRTSC